MHKEVEVTLLSPLKYSKDGEKAEEQVLVLRSPSLAVSQITRKHARKLKALGGEALFKLGQTLKKPEGTSQEASEDSTNSDGNILDAFAFAGIDVSDMCDVMRELAPSVVTIGDKVPFKQAHWDSLDMEDQEKIVGLYIQNFSLRSVLSSQTN